MKFSAIFVSSLFLLVGFSFFAAPVTAEFTAAPDWVDNPSTAPQNVPTTYTVGAVSDGNPPTFSCTWSLDSPTAGRFSQAVSTSQGGVCSTEFTGLTIGEYTISVTVAEPNPFTGDSEVLTTPVEVTGPQVAQVEATIPSADEEGPVDGRFTISRPGGADNSAELVVDVRIGLQSTATESEDYDIAPAFGGTPIQQTVAIPALANSVDVNVEVVQDGDVEGPETVILEILDATFQVVDTATVTIADNDAETGVVCEPEAGADPSEYEDPVYGLLCDIANALGVPNGPVPALFAEDAHQTDADGDGRNDTATISLLTGGYDVPDENGDCPEGYDPNDPADPTYCTDPDRTTDLVITLDLFYNETEQQDIPAVLSGLSPELDFNLTLPGLQVYDPLTNPDDDETLTNPYTHALRVNGPENYLEVWTADGDLVLRIDSDEPGTEDSITERPSYAGREDENGDAVASPLAEIYAPSLGAPIFVAFVTATSPTTLDQDADGHSDLAEVLCSAGSGVNPADHNHAGFDGLLTSSIGWPFKAIQDSDVHCDDRDGDGFSRGLEEQAGSSDFDYESVPFSATLAVNLTNMVPSSLNGNGTAHVLTDAGHDLSTNTNVWIKKVVTPPNWKYTLGVNISAFTDPNADGSYADGVLINGAHFECAAESMEELCNPDTSGFAWIELNEMDANILYVFTPTLTNATNNVDQTFGGAAATMVLPKATSPASNLVVRLLGNDTTTYTNPVNCPLNQRDTLCGSADVEYGVTNTYDVEVNFTNVTSFDAGEFHVALHLDHNVDGESWLVSSGASVNAAMKKASAVFEDLTNGTKIVGVYVNVTNDDADRDQEDLGINVKNFLECVGTGCAAAGGDYEIFLPVDRKVNEAPTMEWDGEVDVYTPTSGEASTPSAENAVLNVTVYDPVVKGDRDHGVSTDAENTDPDAATVVGKLNIRRNGTTTWHVLDLHNNTACEAAAFDSMDPFTYGNADAPPCPSPGVHSDGEYYDDRTDVRTGASFAYVFSAAADEATEDIASGELVRGLKYDFWINITDRDGGYVDAINTSSPIHTKDELASFIMPDLGDGALLSPPGGGDDEGLIPDDIYGEKLWNGPLLSAVYENLTGGEFLGLDQFDQHDIDRDGDTNEPSDNIDVLETLGLYIADTDQEYLGMITLGLSDADIALGVSEADPTTYAIAGASHESLRCLAIRTGDADQPYLVLGTWQRATLAKDDRCVVDESSVVVGNLVYSESDDGMSFVLWDDANADGQRGDASDPADASDGQASEDILGLRVDTDGTNVTIWLNVLGGVTEVHVNGANIYNSYVGADAATIGEQLVANGLASFDEESGLYYASVPDVQSEECGPTTDGTVGPTPVPSPNPGFIDTCESQNLAPLPGQGLVLPIPGEDECDPDTDPDCEGEEDPEVEDPTDPAGGDCSNSPGLATACYSGEPGLVTGLLGMPEGLIIEIRIPTVGTVPIRL